MWYNYNTKIFDEIMNGTYGVYDKHDVSTYQFIDKGDHHITTIPLPGAKKEEIKISVKEDKILVVSYSPANKNPYAESFSRAWNFLNTIDVDNVKADYVDGILTVAVPKVKPPAPKVKVIAVN